MNRAGLMGRKPLVTLSLVLMGAMLAAAMLTGCGSKPAAQPPAPQPAPQPAAQPAPQPAPSQPPAAQPAPSGPKEVVLMTWGGAFTDAFNAVIPGFEKETGIKVKIVSQAGAAAGLSTLKAQKANPQVDVWSAIDSTTQAAWEEGLLEKLPTDLIPNVKDVSGQYVTQYSTAAWLSLRGIFYRSDMVPFEIKKWEDLWDTRLKNKLATTIQLDTGSFLIMSALINGGNEKNIDPGFAKVKELLPNIALFYKTDSESIKFLENGEAAVAAWGILPNVYKLLGPDSKYKFVIPPSPQFVATIPVSIVKGRNNTENSAKFINYLLRPDVQGVLTSQLGAVPSNKTAKAPEKIASIVPPLDKVYQPDWSHVNANFNAWTERWNREIQVGK